MELCSSFWVIFGLFVASLIKCPPCLGHVFWWAAHSWQVCCDALFFHFFYNGFNGGPWDVQSLGYYFITQPWSALLPNFVPDLIGELLGLHGAACLVVPLAWWCCRLWGLSEQVYIYWDHGLYLINYVTSEGNWLHQILFSGFIAKGVNTYACTNFQFFFLELFETNHFFHFTSPIWTILCPLHEIKIQIYLNYRL